MSRTNMRDLTFATFNLLNLQAVGGITYGDKPPYPDTAEGRAAYKAKILWTAERLRDLDAAVIGLQELWSARALDDAFAAAGMTDDYDIVARDAPGPGRPQVALAVRKGRNGQSRLQPGAAWITGFPDTFIFDKLRETDGASEEITVTIRSFSRPILRAVIQPEGTRPKPPQVAIYVAHLKSKGPARLSMRGGPVPLIQHGTVTRSAVSHIRRVMEAGAFRVMLDAETRNTPARPLTPTVVLGDLNDDTLSVTTQLLSAEPGFRLFHKSTAGSTSDRGLYSVEQLQQYRSLRHVYYTHIYRNKMESLDHILVSEEFYDHSARRQWSFRSMDVINDHLNDETSRARGASDHGLVRAQFDWNPMPMAVTPPMAGPEA